MKILLTGGAGYIGSTIASACLDQGVTPVILDDFSTGRREFVRDRIAYEGDISDQALLDEIFEHHPDIHCVVHCAAKIIVPESVDHPLDYYRDNVAKTLDFLTGAIRNGSTRILFSSSASIYAANDDFSVTESSRVDPQSPYAATKVMIERILSDVAASSRLRAVSLRYFNPVGADPAMRTGLPAPQPTHAMGKLIEAFESGTPFTITGVDWPTRDGSGIRDYVHVWDLAQAHVRAIQRFDDIVSDSRRHEVINLGTGHGVTVRELITAFEAVVGPIQIVEGDPRPGDSAGCYTRSNKALELLGFQTRCSMEDAVRDSLTWADKRTLILRS